MNLIFEEVKAIHHADTGLLAKHLRKKAGLTIRQMAKLTGYSASYVSDLEHGKRNWNTEKCERFQKALINTPSKEQSK